MTVTWKRNPFEGMPADERRELMGRIAEFVDRQSKFLGEPTPQIALDLLPMRPPAERPSTG